jgi:hypothetical protein
MSENKREVDINTIKSVHEMIITLLKKFSMSNDNNERQNIRDDFVGTAAAMSQMTIGDTAISALVIPTLAGLFFDTVSLCYDGTSTGIFKVADEMENRPALDLIDLAADLSTRDLGIALESITSVKLYEIELSKAFEKDSELVENKICENQSDNQMEGQRCKLPHSLITKEEAEKLKEIIKMAKNRFQILKEMNNVS